MVIFKQRKFSLTVVQSALQHVNVQKTRLRMAHQRTLRYLHSQATNNLTGNGRREGEREKKERERERERFLSQIKI